MANDNAPDPTPTKYWHGIPIPKVAWVQWFINVIVVAVLTYFGVNFPAPTPPPGPVFEGGQPVQAGWIRSDEEVKAFKSTLAFKTFSDTEAGRQTDMFGVPESVYLWKAQEKVNGGDQLPAYNQGQVGCCVAFGTAYAEESTLCVTIATWDPNKTRGPPPGFRSFSREIVYGGSRVQIGGGRISGDGSVGAWAAKFVSQYGNLPRDVYGKFDLRNYSETTCRQFGKSGVPAELLPKCKDYPVANVTQITSAAEARQALANGYAIAVCSDQGFSMSRDKDGFCKPSGTWNHCMAIDGYQSGARPGFHIRNSWGVYDSKGPVGAGDPSPAGFWADQATVDKMLRQNDSWAFSGVGGFKKREIDWFVMHQPEKSIHNLAREKKGVNDALFALGF